MIKDITICCDDDIAGLLKKQLATNGPFRLKYTASGYSECNDPWARSDETALILQSRGNIMECLGLLNSIDDPNSYAAVIFFEKTKSGTVNYTSTDDENDACVRLLTDVFENALQGRYVCCHSYFRPALQMGGGVRELGRTEALLEIMRGCGEKEIQRYKQLYDLDLRGNGYYLFFWEFQRTEYMRHKENKDIYNYINVIIMRGLQELLSKFAGGEEVHLSHGRRCIIINDLTFRSRAMKSAAFNELIGGLVHYFDSPGVNLYLSNRLSLLSDIRRETELYEINKAQVFFLRDVKLLRPNLVKKEPASAEIDMAFPLVLEIGNYLKYDINSPALLTSVRHLYFDIIKPSMNFGLYYFCTAYIYSNILEESGANDVSILSEDLQPALLQFSSIEEQYDIIRDRIIALQALSGGHRKTKNVLVLQAIDYISKNYDHEISIPELANSLFVSQIHLGRAFKNITGTSIASYIVEYRIEKAKELLEGTDDPIQNIAFSVGFGDAKYFSKKFKAKEGVSPREFRKRSR